MNNIDPALAVYFILMTALGFVSMALDKHRAKLHAHRTPEMVLLLIAAAGGSVGILAGMYLLRHKTRHPKFYIGVPLLLLAQTLLILLLTSVK